MNNSQKTKTIVLSAILTAIVVILQFMGSFIHLGPFSVSLVLIPIAIGAATCGVWISTWLGLVFGFVVLLSGDASAFLAVNAPGAIFTVILKGAACGFAAGIIYKLIERYNRYAAATAAAVICPLVNTGIFLLCCRLFFFDTIIGWAADAGFGDSAGRYMIFGLVGANFLFEFIFNIVLSPVIVRLLDIKNKQN